ncbi:MAG: NTP transferase domain-containing protein [Eubacteriales bacterium]|nr:NTP transferase domain-containing protein [Eubacteriales bacterium]
MKSYVISICGAGGKTTILIKLALYYAKKNYKVAVLTTTHMCHIKSKYFDCYGVDAGSGKIGYIGDEEYKRVCKEYDYIIIEADGSRTKPMKIPNDKKEPVIPDNTNEIHIVFGAQAIGRKISAVCHRYESAFDNINENINQNTNKEILEVLHNKDKIVDEHILKLFMKYFYINPLKNKYKNIKIYSHIVDLSKSNNYKKYKNISFVLMASGSSIRFGENKLLYKINNKKMYEIVLDTLNNTKLNIIKYFKQKFNYDLNIQIVLVTSHKEIIEEQKSSNKQIVLYNDNANEGLSSTIRISTEYLKNNTDAICYVPGDLIGLKQNEFESFIRLSLLSNNDISCFVSNYQLSSPTFIQKKFFDKAMEVKGDKGLRELIKEKKFEAFLYHILEEDFLDIDTKEDLKKFKEEDIK